MKKNIVYILFFLSSYSIYSQGIYFNLGKNFSTFSYYNRTELLSKLEIKGVGDAYEIGYTDVLKYKKFKDLKYTGSITINDFNGTAYSELSKIEYKTTYLGVQSTLDFQFYESYNFILSAKAGLNLSTIVRGVQTVKKTYSFKDETWKLADHFLYRKQGIIKKLGESENFILTRKNQNLKRITLLNKILKILI